jgi:hypothetical protein
MRIPRNRPCPCLSGKKYKQCHGALELEGIELASVHPGVAPPDVFRKAAALSKIQQERERRLGSIGLPNTIEFGGQRMVGVGDLIIAIDPKYPPLNVAAELLLKALGQKWFGRQLKRPANKLHPVISWYLTTRDWMEKYADTGGKVQSVLPGPAKAWFLLAWDVWVLQHHFLLEKLLPRLRNRREFQGARYELTAYALFIRGGFTPKPEDEKDSSKHHVEFIATHGKTGEQVAVEAKIRHRPGVLGFPGTPSSSDTGPGITDRLRDALRKRPGVPYVICIDLNLPPAVDAATARRTLDAAHGEVEAQSWERARNDRPFPATMVIITNYAHHYGDPNEPDPNFYQSAVRIGRPAHPFTKPETADQIVAALQAYGNLPQKWEDLDR